jgi:hypothetical protein
VEEDDEDEELPDPEEEEEEEEEEEDEEEDEERKIEEDVELLFFSRTKRPKHLVCPFSDAARPNPCTTHEQPRKKKKSIQKHLQHVKEIGGDEKHPLDDPLWSTFEVNWFLTSRPKFNKKKKLLAQSKSHSLYYKKRKATQEKYEAQKRQMFENGEIGEDEYKKVLIGEKRRKFITERDVEKKVQARMEGEMESMRKDMERERDLREDIEKRLQDLRSKDCTTDAESTNNTAAIAALEAARSELDSTQAAVEAYKAALAKLSTNVVDLSADDRFLPSTDMAYLQYYGFSWPTTPSEEAFYVFATFLTPKKNWDSQIRSPSNIRHMHQELRTYVEATKDPDNNPQEALKLDRIVQTFSSCCDVIKQSSEHTESMSQDGAQRWIDEHEKMWTDAKLAFQSRFGLDSQAPIQHIQLIDQFVDVWRAQKAAQESNETARLLAGDLV